MVQLRHLNFYLLLKPMEYSIKLTDKDLEQMALVLQEWPYRLVKPILDKIGQQIDTQNKPLEPNKE
jgi:tRNA A37 threonylcarbamoyladenosine biosynthesis protein TsaE